MKIRNLRPLLAVGMLYAFPFAVLMTNFNVLVLDSLKWDAASIGLIGLTIGLMDIAVQGWLVGKLLPLFGAKKLITAGLVLQGVAYGLVGLVAVVPSGWLLIVGTLVYAFSSRLVEPSLAALTSQAVGPELQGLVNGASQSLQSLTRVIGPVWVGVIYTDFGHATPCWLNIIFVGVGILTVLATVSSVKAAEKSQEQAVNVS